MTTNFQPSTPPDQPVVPSMSTTPHAASSYTSPYLPAGAPPWPTTVLQRTLPTTGSAFDPAAGKIAERKSRSVRSAFIALSVIVLTLLVGVGLTYGVLYFNGQVAANTPSASHPVTIAKATVQPTAGGAGASTPSTSTGSLPTPTSFSTMSSDHQKSIGVLVKYPSDWIEEPSTSTSQSGTVVAVFHPQQALGIAVYVGKFSVTASGVTTTSALNQGLIGTIYGGNGSSGNTNLQAVQSTTPHRTIAGEQWDEQDATFSDPNSELMHVSSITIRHGSFFYSFIFQTPDIYYNDVTQKYVPPMLDSFKFLS